MKDEKVYLKPNVILEPLIDKWYAWTHLIYPPTAAMNMKSRHLKIMNSYVQAPNIHMAATKNPKMLGGPFMNYDSNRKEEVQGLIKHAFEERKPMFELAEAIHELTRLLKKHGTGHSLEPLYEKVPEILKGYVELNYDLNGNPSFRIFESLMYKSEYYNTDTQSITLWLTENDERPFVLSTARLPEKNCLEINIPFAHEAIDKMCSMRNEADTLENLIKDFKISEDQKELFESFFTTEKPVKYQKYTGDKIRMRYYGHACILIETKDISILVDPVISYYGYQNEVNRYSLQDLPEEIDYVLITHNHQDHILFETMLSLRHMVKNIVVPKGTTGNLQDPNLKIMLQTIGFKNVIELQDMETIEHKECKITGIPFLGEHGDLDIQAKICYHVNIGKNSMIFMADSCNIEPKLYDLVAKQVGSIDVIFLGMECDGAPFSWVYGPLIEGEVDREMDNGRRLAGSNFDRGKGLVKSFKPKELYVYAMGLEPWVEFISSVRFDEAAHPIVASNNLISHCTENNIKAERLYGEKELHYEID